MEQNLEVIKSVVRSRGVIMHPISIASRTTLLGACLLVPTFGCSSNDLSPTSARGLVQSLVPATHAALHVASILSSMRGWDEVGVRSAHVNSTHRRVNRTASRGAEASAASASQSAPAAPTPPAGWEVPVVAAKAQAAKKNAAPACCGYDKLCCSRQADVDAGAQKPARAVFAVRFSDVPEATIKEPGPNGPPVEGVPEVLVVDGMGAPFPWLEGPKQFEVRIVPKGTLGFMRFGNDFAGKIYERPDLKSLGYGVTIPINDTPDKGKSLVKGPLEYWTFSRGEGDKITHDHVKGKLDQSTKVIVERWAHVDAINAAEGIVHVYRTTYEDKPHVFFVLPEVATGFESKEAKSFGGTERGRFGTNFPYTLYRFALGPGRSNTVNCKIDEYEVKRWFDRPKNALKVPDDMLISISMSQTSVESEPRIQITFF